MIYPPSRAGIYKNRVIPALDTKQRMIIKLDF
jgi:hypothetical protein